MKLKKKLTVTMVFILILGACSSNSTEKEKADLKTEVLAIHDEVMPKMSAIFHLVEQLDNFLEGQDSVTDESQRQTIYDLKVALERADEGMMDWMAEFQPVDEMPATDAIEYLKKEQEKVTTVKEDMLSSIQNAETFIKSKNDDGN